MALGQALKGRKSFTPPALQITSMMDMFTIIVFFLLFSYSDKPDEFDLGQGLELPASTVEIDYKNSVALFISLNDVRIDDAVVATISNNRVNNLDPSDLEKSALFTELDALKKEKYSDKIEGEEVKPPHVLVFCDQKIPFKTLNLIIKTAGLAGFTNFQLAVTEAG